MSLLIKILFLIVFVIPIFDDSNFSLLGDFKSLEILIEELNTNKNKIKVN